MTRPSALTGFNEKTELGVVPEQTQLDEGTHSPRHPEAERACRDCRFWFEPRNNSRLRPNQRECRAAAPDPQGFAVSFGYDWCGQFERRSYQEGRGA